MRIQNPRQRIIENPFYVLGLPAECSRGEVEREGQKLLGMLELGLSAARTYATPLGSFERTSDAVRAAMAELRDPERRLLHEAWARLAPRPAQAPGAAQAPRSGAAAGDPDTASQDRAPIPASPAGWPGALAALGWRR